MIRAFNSGCRSRGRWPFIRHPELEVCVDFCFRLAKPVIINVITNEKILHYILVSILLVVSSCSSNEKSIAIENFNNHINEIESIVETYQQKPLLTYIEFNDSTVDLSIVDPQKTNNSGEFKFEFRIFGNAIESGEIRKALSYSSTSLEEINVLKSKLKMLIVYPFLDRFAQIVKLHLR